MDTQKAKAQYAIRAIANAVVDTVRETGTAGAPASMVYLALQAQGATMAQFNALIDALIHVGKLKRKGDLLFVA